jgi:protein-disulfide isomerase
MGMVSLKLHNFCLFCIAAYALSLIQFLCYQKTLQEPFFANLGPDLGELWSESKGIVVGFAAIPVLAFVGHRMMLEAYGVTQVSKIVQISINDWKNAARNDLNVAPALATGPDRAQAKLVISEFADFRCHHCKNAYPSLDHFAHSHSEVRLEFYNFPLDGECNDDIPDKSGISCRLAYAVACAERQGAGWAMHHTLYDHQDSINDASLGRGKEKMLDEEIKTLATRLNLKIDDLFRCMDEPSVKDAIRLQAKQGTSAKIQGTPSIFANGKLLERGQLIPVLEGVLANP